MLDSSLSCSSFSWRSAIAGLVNSMTSIVIGMKYEPSVIMICKYSITATEDNVTLFLIISHYYSLSNKIRPLFVIKTDRKVLGSFSVQCEVGRRRQTP